MEKAAVEKAAVEDAAMRARRDAVGDPQELLMDKKRNLQRQLREIEVRLTGADTAKLEEGLLQEDGRDAEIGHAGDRLALVQQALQERGGEKGTILWDVGHGRRS